MTDDFFPSPRRNRAAGSGSDQHLSHLLELSDEERAVVQWLLRNREASTSALAEQFSRPESEMDALLAQLAEKGFAEAAEGEPAPRWRAHVPPRKGRKLPDKLWNALE